MNQLGVRSVSASVLLSYLSRLNRSGATSDYCRLGFPWLVLRHSGPTLQELP